MRSSTDSLGTLKLPFIKCELKTGDVVEFRGCEGCAKSEMLLDIAATCILPTTWNGVSLPGYNTNVVFVSTDYKFDLTRLVTILESKISMSNAHLHAYEIVISSLSRIQLLYCNTSIKLQATLMSLPTYFNRNSCLGVLMLDSVASFYWNEKSDCDRVDIDSKQLQWISLLHELIIEHPVIILATKPLYFKGRANTTGSLCDNVSSPCIVANRPNSSGTVPNI